VNSRFPIEAPTGTAQRGRASRKPVDTDETGFTLLELLIALTLLAALSVLLFGGLRFGTRAWERSEAVASETDQIGIAQSFLRRALSTSYPLLKATDAARPKIDFEGSSEGMRFLAPAPAALSAGGMSRFTLIATRRNDQNLLLMTSRFELTREEIGSSATDFTLLHGFEHVEFRYFCSDQPADPPTWRDSWTERARLPELVGIQVRFPAGDRRTWPELLVAPRLTADASCLYDPVIRRCRGR